MTDISELLGDLAFNQEELTGLYVENGCCGEKLKPQGAGLLSAELNRILAEKLAKAPVVSMGVDAEIWYPGDVTEYGAIKTHSARLVCITEIANKTPPEK